MKTSVSTNRFDDVCVTCDAPLDALLERDTHVVMTHTLRGMFTQQLPYLLMENARYGRVIGNERAHRYFATLQNGVKHGVAVVLFVTHGAKVYAVVVKDRTKPYFMNVGATQECHERALQDTARRALHDELGVKVDHLAPVGTFTHDAEFACLQIQWFTQCYFARVTEPPAGWLEAIARGAILDVEAPKVERVAFLDLERMDHARANVSDHHWNLIAHIAQREGLCAKQAMRDVSYLTSFRVDP